MVCLGPSIRLLAGFAALATLLLVPAAARAATPPALVLPAPGASMTADASVTFEWVGELQGESGTQTRASAFLVQVLPIASLPADVEAAWPETTSSLQTQPGVAATSAVLAAPEAGRYAWRVCALGVRDTEVSNTIEQLACSTPSTLTVAAPAAGGEVVDPGSLNVTTRRTRQGSPVVQTRTDPQSVATKRIFRTRPGGAAPAVTFDVDSLRGVFGSDGSDSSVELGEIGLAGGAGDGGTLGGLGGSVLSGLSWKVPGVAVPFWALLLLALTIPMSIWWRRTALTMFDLPTVAQAGELDELDELVDDAADVAASAQSSPHGGEHVSAVERRAA